MLKPTRPLAPLRTVNERCSRRQIATIAVAALLAALSAALAPQPAVAGYIVNNLVSDLPGVAARVDPNLVNPWGLTRSATSPWWVADNGTGVSTLYNGGGTPQALIVTIPPPAGGTPPSAPTGVVFNSNNTIVGSPRFIFSTEDGVIASWAGAAIDGTNAIRRIDNSTAGAVYKGLAIGKNGSDVVYATDFHNDQIDAFSFDPSTSIFGMASLPGNFTDPNLPSGYAPFGIQNINDKLYVTYALQDAAGKDDVAGPGHGFVDVFDTNGNFQQRFASDRILNSPWGLALAPSDFGEFSNDLLVGNFGEGTISAFDPVTGNFSASSITRTARCCGSRGCGRCSSAVATPPRAMRTTSISPPAFRVRTKSRTMGCSALSLRCRNPPPPCCCFPLSACSVSAAFRVGVRNRSLLVSARMCCSSRAVAKIRNYGKS